MKKRKRRCWIAMACMMSLLCMSGCSSETEETKKVEEGEVSSSQQETSKVTFETTEIDGTAYTDAMFGEYELTMVNVFATWCPPCIKEIPELQKLYETMKEQGVGVAGVVLDTVDAEGQPDQAALESAKLLKERAQVTYPFLMPDENNMNGRLNNIQSVPTTFFVDREGNMVGKVYQGSADLEAWTNVVEKELAAVRGEAQ